MRETRTYGSVRGASSNGRPYRDSDRVGRQACFQAVPVRSMALSVTTSLRMQAVSASFDGFPAWRSRS